MFKLIEKQNPLACHGLFESLERADGSFMDEKTLTKTAMDYAEWLITKREN